MGRKGQWSDDDEGEGDDDDGDGSDDEGGSGERCVHVKPAARRRTCLSTRVIPPIWIIKSKSVCRIHQSPHCSQMTPRCAEDMAAYGDENMTLYSGMRSQPESCEGFYSVMNDELYILGDVG